MPGARDCVSLTILNTNQLPPAVIYIFCLYSIPAAYRSCNPRHVPLRVFQVYIVAPVIPESHDASRIVIVKIKRVCASRSCVLDQDLSVHHKVFCCYTVYRLLRPDSLLVIQIARRKVLARTACPCQPSPLLPCKGICPVQIRQRIPTSVVCNALPVIAGQFVLPASVISVYDLRNRRIPA